MVARICRWWWSMPINWMYLRLNNLWRVLVYSASFRMRLTSTDSLLQVHFWVVLLLCSAPRLRFGT